MVMENFKINCINDDMYNDKIYLRSKTKYKEQKLDNVLLMLDLLLAVTHKQLRDQMFSRGCF